MRIFSSQSTSAEGTPKLSLVLEEKQPLSVNQPAKNEIPQSIESFLEAEGLIPDQLTVRLLQVLEQTGLKIDKTLMQKARNASLGFGKKSKKAAEVAALLLEKGIYPSKEAIEAILSVTDFSESSHKKDENGELKNAENTENEEGTFIDKLYAVPPGKKEGLLTLFNHTALKNKHWILLPFEMQGRGKEGAAWGSIKILLNISSKNTEKMHINCKTHLNNYSFLLYYRGGSPVSLAFCISPEPKQKEKQIFCKALRENLSLGGFSAQIDVSYSADALLQEDLFTTDSLPSFVSVYA